MGYETILYEVDAAQRVATITLNRPAVLNAFNRTMCHEVRDTWHRIKADPEVNAVVLRAAGDRAFCAGLDISEDYGQPADVWNHEDPGELLSPKWQKVWKPVVSAVQGICTAGAFYFLNEADIVICSEDTTFFDSHVTYGLVSAIEPVGLMRRVGLAETLRIALSGNDERVSAATALRISLVTEVVAREQLWAHADEIAAAIATKPSAATQGTVRAIWESLDKPYRAAVEQGLSYTRIGNPIGSAEIDRRVDAALDPADPLMSEAFRRRLREVVAIDPGAPAIEFEGQWHSWGDLAATMAVVADAFGSLALAPGAQVGILLRNRPESIGAVLGVLDAGGCVVVLNPQLGAERLGADLASLDLALVVGGRADIDAVPAGAAQPAVPTLTVDGVGAPGRLDRPGAVTPQPLRPDTAIRLLTSGTTGPPKRSDLTFTTLDRVLQGAKHYESKRAGASGLREGIVIVNAPLVHLGGLFRVLQSVVDGRRMALLERFTVAGWVDVVRRHRPKTASLVPTALRMVLDADLDPADLASLRSVISGTAPLNPETADAFTTKYGVPVLTNYAATEFGGGVAGWNLADHQRFWTDKRGSVGRAHPGCGLRIVDEDGTVLAVDAVGLLEVTADQLPGSGWIRTNDLARLDADGFLWVLGRADQTIIRGGLKVQPDTVRSTLERHPAVRAAAVVGVDDERLGQVPVAIVERVESSDVGEAGVLAHVAQYLARYEIPVRVVFVDTLPRTASAKVDLQAVRALAAPPVGLAKD